METDLALVRLLREIFQLTLSSATPNQLALMAMQIRTNYYDLRFEEIMFALNKGINSGYGASNKNLAYDTISQWLKEYREVDRMGAVETMVQTNKNKHASKISKEDVPDEMLYLNAKYTGKPAKKELSYKEQLTQLDEQQWAYFLANKNGMRTSDLHDLLKQTQASCLKKTATAIELEIESRTK